MIDENAQDIPILHLASHARAGETLILKLLNANSRISVPVQIENDESILGQHLIDDVRRNGTTSIPFDHPYARQESLLPGCKILIKQGVWHHTYPFQGIALVRNPLSFVDSMLTYNEREGLNFGIQRHGRKKYRRTFERLLRWSKDMSQEMLSEIESKTSVIDALCAFYNQRIGMIISYHKPIFKYEDLVRDPALGISQMCKCLQVPFEQTQIDAHHAYASTDKGHGMNDLSRPIDSESLLKWRARPPSLIAEIRMQTADAGRSVGYTFSEDYLTPPRNAVP